MLQNIQQDSKNYICYSIDNFHPHIQDTYSCSDTYRSFDRTVNSIRNLHNTHLDIAQDMNQYTMRVHCHKININLNWYNVNSLLYMVNSTLYRFDLHKKNLMDMCPYMNFRWHNKSQQYMIDINFHLYKIYMDKHMVYRYHLTRISLLNMTLDMNCLMLKNTLLSIEYKWCYLDNINSWNCIWCKYLMLDSDKCLRDIKSYIYSCIKFYFMDKKCIYQGNHYKFYNLKNIFGTNYHNLN